MADSNVNIQLNIIGNAQVSLDVLNKSVKALPSQVSKASEAMEGLGKSLMYFNQASEYFRKLSNTMNDTIQPGIALNTSLADLSAIAGVTGDRLNEIEGFARKSAETFGGSAADAVESYKLLLSQLSPELAKTPEAMKEMGDNIAILSKTMGGDTRAAAEVLTTAMNQYGVSMKDPTAAAKKMAEMMNIMAAAGKEGSAEIPQIKEALEQAGMAAKGAGVSFEETNSAIQVLDKAGKKGSEGGIALRNVMATLSQGRFLPKDIQDELSASGIDIEKLSDKSLSLSDRLKLLKPVMQDSALLTKMFGRENANAAMALVLGTEEMDRYTDAITGTNTAQDQASIIMDTYAERQARIQSKFDDLKISIFNATGDMGIWAQTIASSVVTLADMAPLFSGAAKAVSLLTNKEKIHSAWTCVLTAKQWLLNIALNANPIGLVVLGIAALVAIVTVVTAKYDEWGASLALLLGPLGMIINVVQAFRRNWDSIVESFRTDGILGGIKRIGVVLLDAILYPVQQVLGMLAKIPGLSNLASGGTKKIAEIRSKLELADPIKYKKEGDGKGLNEQMYDYVNGKNGDGVPNAAKQLATATATGGTRNTSITINLGKMVESIVFNGGLSENKENMTKQVEEAMYRVLLSAQSAG